MNRDGPASLEATADAGYAPGWYLDPTGTTSNAYWWNGQQWTGNVYALPARVPAWPPGYPAALPPPRVILRPRRRVKRPASTRLCLAVAVTAALGSLGAATAVVAVLVTSSNQQTFPLTMAALAMQCMNLWFNLRLSPWQRFSLPRRKASVVAAIVAVTATVGVFLLIGTDKRARDELGAATILLAEFSWLLFQACWALLARRWRPSDLRAVRSRPGSRSRRWLARW
jgi:hypothetical protein